MAERLKRYNYQKSEEFILVQNEVRRSNNQSLDGVHPSYVSPFFTIGNSFGFNPHDRSIRHFGSYYAKIEIDNHNVGDGHKYFARQLLRNPSFLEKKKACILITQINHLSSLENIETVRNLEMFYPYSLSLDSIEEMKRVISPQLKENSKNNALIINIEKNNIDSPSDMYISIPPSFYNGSERFLLNLEFTTEDQKNLPSIRFMIGNNLEESKTSTVSLCFTSNDIDNGRIRLSVSAWSRSFIELKRIDIRKQ